VVIVNTHIILFTLILGFGSKYESVNCWTVGGAASSTRIIVSVFAIPLALVAGCRLANVHFDVCQIHHFSTQKRQSMWNKFVGLIIKFVYLYDYCTCETLNHTSVMVDMVGRHYSSQQYPLLQCPNANTF